jgi:hypothetical protein
LPHRMRDTSECRVVALLVHSLMRHVRSRRKPTLGYWTAILVLTRLRHWRIDFVVMHNARPHLLYSTGCPRLQGSQKRNAPVRNRGSLVVLPDLDKPHMTGREWLRVNAAMHLIQLIVAKLARVGADFPFNSGRKLVQRHCSFKIAHGFVSIGCR